MGVACGMQSWLEPSDRDVLLPEIGDLEVISLVASFFVVVQPSRVAVLGQR